MYKNGDILKVKVTGIEDYGIFVIVDGGFSGLIHISEISDKFVRDISDYVQVGEEIFASVLACDDSEKKVKLSIKNLNYKKDGSVHPDKIDGFSTLRRCLPEWIKSYKGE